ncbi:MAG TPA: hypothetical protein VFW00_14800 [Rhodocyclaceae bacterium]|nr:hypothetical protein [Rhodocyclaceae bacterium]
MHLYRILIAVVFCIAAVSAGAAINNNIRIANGPVYNQGGDPNAYIGCSLSGGGISCFAADSNNYASCYTTDPKMKRLLPMINKTSDIQFVWNADGTCYSLGVTSGGLGGATKGSGYKWAPEPIVGSGYAYGSVSAPVNRSGESVRCNVASGPVTQIVCSAQDNAGNKVMCSTASDQPWQTLDDMALAVSSINESSLVEFLFDSAAPTPTCTYIYVVNSSYSFP